MITCDICDDEIRRMSDIYLAPAEYEIPEVTEICKQCNQKINIAADKINQDSMKVRRDAKRAMIQQLKDSQGNL